MCLLPGRPQAGGELYAAGGGGGPAWPGRLRSLGLFEPDADELAKMRAAFGLHELAIEDAQALHRRPKIESYDEDVRLVVVRTCVTTTKPKRSSSVRSASSSRRPS